MACAGVPKIGTLHGNFGTLHGDFQRSFLGSEHTFRRCSRYLKHRFRSFKRFKIAFWDLYGAKIALSHLKSTVFSIPY